MTGHTPWREIKHKKRNHRETQRKLEQVVEALERVQWGYAVGGSCLACGSTRDEGHGEGCVIGAALAAVREDAGSGA